jgi:hypothetical protein
MDFGNHEESYNQIQMDMEGWMNFKLS